MVWIWIGFVAWVLFLLSADLFLFHRRPHEISVREALFESAIWLGLSLLFAVFIHFAYGRHLCGMGAAEHHSGRHYAVLYITGYLVELSLSIDNLLVIAVLFKFFSIPPRHQYRVLFWGIIGAQIMRGALIGGGAVLIRRFHWILYIFATFLLYAAYRIGFTHGKSDPGHSPILRFINKTFPVTPDLHGSHFLIRDASRGRRAAWLLTPLALTLLMVEATDLLFAVDSIPAIFAITTDPFIVFTSNIFAVLGLRSMYFALIGAMQRLRYLNLSLAVLLALIGLKMFAHPWIDAHVHHESLWTLVAIVVVIATGVITSLLATGRENQSAQTTSSTADSVAVDTNAKAACDR